MRCSPRSPMPACKDHYRREVKNRLFALWREQGSRRGKPAADAPRSARADGTAARFLALRLRDRHHPCAHQSSLAARPLRRGSFGPRHQGQEARDLAGAVTGIILEDGTRRERIAERIEASGHGKFYAELTRDSAFTRLAFLDPASPRPEVEAAIRRPHLPVPGAAEPDPRARAGRRSSCRCRAKPSSSASPRFSSRWRASATEHAADDAGDRDAAKRFEETIARLKGDEYRGPARSAVRKTRARPEMPRWPRSASREARDKSNPRKSLRPRSSRP